MTQPINLIAKHLDQSNLKLDVLPCKAFCSFTGQYITKGVLNKGLIKKTFTDHSYLKVNSEWSSVDAALCIESVIPSMKKGKFNSLRNYSYLVTDKELLFLKRDEVLRHVLSPPKEPFVFCVTYSNKKHTAYKSVLNTSQNEFIVTTDIGLCRVNKKDLDLLLPIMQSWYSVLPEKSKTAALPTFFTKAEIQKGCSNFQKIKRYDMRKYLEENRILAQYRNTNLMRFLSHILNKNIC